LTRSDSDHLVVRDAARVDGLMSMGWPVVSRVCGVGDR
jgi:hypothetical protein